MPTAQAYGGGSGHALQHMQDLLLGRPQHIGQADLIQGRQKRLQRLAQHAFEPAAGGEQAATLLAKAFHQHQIGFHLAHHIAYPDFGGRAGQA